MSFICPVCGDFLSNDKKSLRCARGHCFDISKHGYVNLMLSQKSSAKRHGDDRLMVEARRDFLSRGYYSSLRSAVARAAAEYSKPSCRLLDAGCGEGWYCEEVSRQARCGEIYAIDVSRFALRLCARRLPDAQLACASVYRLPLADRSCDIILSIFAPFAPEEFSRVLSETGVIIRVVPLEDHLFSLKQCVYDKPYKSPPDDAVPPSLELVDQLDVTEEIHIDASEDIRNLFMMTPYYYKTGVADQAKLNSVSELSTELACRVQIMRKR